MSCCGRNNRNFFSRKDNCCDRDNRCCDRFEDDRFDRRDDDCCDRFDDDCCGRHDNKCCNDLTGISCPFNNNNDCECARSLREAACRLTNQRVIIHVDGCKMCVVIVGIGKCFLKTVNPCTQRIVYFNLNRIDNIEDVLPRCF